MKKLSSLLLAVAFLTSNGQATSLHPDTNRKISPKLVTTKVSKVEAAGRVLEVRRNHPFTNFVIGIPVEVSTGSACINFIGQQTTQKTGPRTSINVLTAMAATNPLTQACIEIFPMPTKHFFTVEMNVLTGGFVPAHSIQRMQVEITTAGKFMIELDMKTNRVTIQKLFAEVL